jgi:hypothetical protein
MNGFTKKKKKKKRERERRLLKSEKSREVRVWGLQSNSRCQNVVMSLPRRAIFLPPKKKAGIYFALYTGPEKYKNQLSEIELTAFLIKRNNLNIFT